MVGALAGAHLGACTPRDEGTPAAAVGEGAVEPVAPARDRTFDPVTVQFHVVAEVPRKPPLLELAVDVVVLNHASESRWVLLPRVAGVRPGEGGGGVNVLEVERWGERLVVGSWMGGGGFRAVRVGADGHVRLASVPMEWWRADVGAVGSDGDGDAPRAGTVRPAHLYPSMEAVAVRALLVDDKRAETYFAADPTAPAGPAGGIGGDGARRSVIANVRHREDGAEVAVELLEPVEVRYVPWPRD